MYVRDDNSMLRHVKPKMVQWAVLEQTGCYVRPEMVQWIVLAPCAKPEKVQWTVSVLLISSLL